MKKIGILRICFLLLLGILLFGCVKSYKQRSFNYPTVNVPLRIIADDSVNLVELTDFLEKLNVYLLKNINVKLRIDNQIVINNLENCRDEAAKHIKNEINLMLTLCFAPDKNNKGFMGPPLYLIGIDTTPKATEKRDSEKIDYNWNSPIYAVQTTAHEIAHFLGARDLYWYDLENNQEYNAPKIDNSDDDLFYQKNYVNSLYIIHGFEIIKYNLLMTSSNRPDAQKTLFPKKIFYPKSRAPVAFEVFLPKVFTECDILSSIRNYNTFNSKISLKKVPYEKLDMPSQKPSLKNDGLRLVIDYENLKVNVVDNDFDLLLIQCSNKKYWINSLLIDECYLAIPQAVNRLCYLKCTVPDNWCNFEKAVEKPVSKSDSSGTENSVVNQATNI
ncbi:MAG: hypothetical protein V1859_10250 [archaeon]